MAHRRIKLLLGPVLAALIIATPYAIASAIPTLPAKTAPQILATISKADRIPGFTGTLVQTSNLGLPDLSGSLTGASAGTTAATATDTLTNTLSLLSANQRARISIGDAGARIQLYKLAGEQDLIINRGNIWTWDYDTQTATHTKLPTVDAATGKKLAAALTLATPTQPMYTPAELSQALVDSLDEHTKVSVGQNTYVAGQATYTVVFTPREQASLIGSIRLAVDAKTGMVLQFTIYPRESTTPAYQLGYTNIRYGQPDAATFAFNPPPGAKVKTTDYSLAALKQQLTHLDSTKAQNNVSSGARQLVTLIGGGAVAAGNIKVGGTGWASTLTLPAGTLPVAGNKMVRTLTTALPDGDRLLSTTLLNAVISQDGSVRLGAVTVNTLTR